MKGISSNGGKGQRGGRRNTSQKTKYGGEKNKGKGNGEDLNGGEEVKPGGRVGGGNGYRWTV